MPPHGSGRIEYEFYYGSMAGNPTDRILIARLAGTAWRHARRPALAEAEHHAAVAELATIAQGRADSSPRRQASRPAPTRAILMSLVVSAYSDRIGLVLRKEVYRHMN
jgi:hypothetical protein